MAQDVDPSRSDGSFDAVYQIEREMRLVRATLTGRLTAPRCAAAQARLRRDPDFDPDYVLLCDLQACDLSDMSAADVQNAAGGSPFHPQARRAYVVSRDLHYGLLRMFQAHSRFAGALAPVAVFRDVQAALHWLGVNLTR